MMFLGDPDINDAQWFKQLHNDAYEWTWATFHHGWGTELFTRALARSGWPVGHRVYLATRDTKKPSPAQTTSLTAKVNT